MWYSEKPKVILSPYLFFFLALFTISTSGAWAQCIEVSNATGTFINDAAVGNVAFSNPSNASADDNNNAVASTVLSIMGSAQSNYLKATGLGFAIPSHATICGVSVEVRKRATGVDASNHITDAIVRLVKAGVISGDNKATSSYWTETEQLYTYGGSSDLWGVTLTPDDVNNGNFGVVVSATFAGLLSTALSARIDEIRVKVHYSVAPLPIQIINFKANPSGNLVHIKWDVADIEEPTTLIIQQLHNDGHWHNIHQYRFTPATKTNHSGHYQHMLSGSGNYQYRLQLIPISGKSIYSDIRSVASTTASHLSVYPNPAHAVVTVSAEAGCENIIVTNLFQQMVRVPVKRHKNNSLQMDVSQLPAGIYFVHAGNTTAKFIKE